MTVQLRPRFYMTVWGDFWKSGTIYPIGSTEKVYVLITLKIPLLYPPQKRTLEKKKEKARKDKNEERKLVSSWPLFG